MEGGEKVLSEDMEGVLKGSVEEIDEAEPWESHGMIKIYFSVSVVEKDSMRLVFGWQAVCRIPSRTIIVFGERSECKTGRMNRVDRCCSCEDYARRFALMGLCCFEGRECRSILGLLNLRRTQFAMSLE